MSITGQTLSVDGGGVRGIIPARILEAIEKEKGAPIRRIFDLAAGTSTGSLVTGGLWFGKFTASQLVDTYKQISPKIFSETWKQEVESGNGYYSSKYLPDGLEAVLKDFAGEAKLSDVEGDVLFTTVKVYGPTKSPELCYISKTTGWGQVLGRDVLRATTAAPTFFPAPKLTVNNESFYCLDGGCMENNPSMTAALACANKLGCGPNQIVVSLGTGVQPVSLSDSVVVSGGTLSWALPIMDVLFEGQEVTADRYTRDFLGTAGTYMRAQMDVSGHKTLDDASTANLNALVEIADAWIADHDKELTAVCDQLKVREDDVPLAKRTRSRQALSGSNLSS